MAIEATICVIRKDGRLLLQEKEKGPYRGRWGAPGGKLNPSESPLDCAIREVEEETGLRVAAPTFHGTFSAYFGASEEPHWIVHVFSATRFSGRLRESDEGPLRWFPEDDLPDRMWPSDRLWLADLLAGRLEARRFQASLRFDEKGEKLLDHAVGITQEA